jgi:hypothetical protein
VFVTVDHEAVDDSDAASEIVHAASNLDPVALLSRRYVIDRQSQCQRAGLDRRAAPLCGAMNGEPRCVVGQARDHAPVEKSPAVAVLLCDGQPKNDRLLVASRVEGAPRVGDRAPTAPDVALGTSEKAGEF